MDVLIFVQTNLSGILGCYLFLFSQVARYLVKSFRQSKTENCNLADSVQYLLDSSLDKDQDTSFQPISAKSIVDQFRHVAYGQIKEAVGILDQWILKGGYKAEETAWNNASIELAKASLAHVRYFVIKVFADNLSQDIISMSKPLKDILMELFELLACTWIQQNFGDFLRHSTMQVMISKCYHCNYIRYPLK